ncbi:hypothetical protein GQR60_19500 [Labilibaculum sp. A4]|uniref:Uncharacterized protein n=1 Tax=Labilibaculum euxinus TaxID=2686357 RepID=A0A425Y0P6_9BACT|nr:hypothetical protein [Labilibaculum euxinus]MDQ1771630.1 hypothetical protein [Labilibaculum euxinus]MUP37046.1 hypothetical protein [Labilibaculum euxinus]MVB06251.1 hypothetical protein [Labilibaculum euxinus]MWN78523.1 hypothetical protein [Labilibaculum euxinus]
MKNILILSILLLGTISQINAQLKLRTPEGKVVLLFDNGTWKYEEIKKVEEPVVPIKSAEEIAKPLVIIDAELESQTVIKGISEKLNKFSDTNNQVKADFQIISKEGKVILKTNWKIMDAEGFRFFGFITKKSKMLFSLSNGESIELQYAEDFEPKEYPKYKFTTFTAELELNEDQIRKLQNAYLEKVEMYWSRRTESYEIFNPDYFVKELPKIIK